MVCPIAGVSGIRLRETPVVRGIRLRRDGITLFARLHHTGSRAAKALPAPRAARARARPGMATWLSNLHDTSTLLATQTGRTSPMTTEQPTFRLPHRSFLQA